MVSLAKKSPEERLNICRKYYLGGFAFLPLLWLINTIWFYKQAFKVEPFPQQAEIRKCKYKNSFLIFLMNFVLDVIRSAVGTFVWLIIIIIWTVMFQVFRTKMGPAGDYLTLVVPRGYY
jgi:presenilin enhancer 2